MKICILHIGSASSDLATKHQPAPDRFRNLLGPMLPEAQWFTISCINDKAPDQPDQFDAYLITGGKYSVFDEYDWQQTLFQFIRAVYDKCIPIAGICYGHQAIAYALGGKVERSDNGWGVGIKLVNVVNPPHWVTPSQRNVRLLSMHQDEVVQLPLQATQFMKSDHCEYSGYFIDDHVLGIQHHPDFTKELCRDLIIKRKARIGEKSQSALASLSGDHNGYDVCKWMANFFRLGART